MRWTSPRSTRSTTTCVAARSPGLSRSPALASYADTSRQRRHVPPGRRLLPSPDLARLLCERTRFGLGATFRETRFEGSAWFVSSVFLAAADFIDAVFSATVSFHSAEVRGELAFPGAVFTAGANFDRVRTHRVDLPEK